MTIILRRLTRSLSDYLDTAIRKK